MFQFTWTYTRDSVCSVSISGTNIDNQPLDIPIALHYLGQSDNAFNMGAALQKGPLPLGWISSQCLYKVLEPRQLTSHNWFMSRVGSTKMATPLVRTCDSIPSVAQRYNKVTPTSACQVTSFMAIASSNFHKVQRLLLPLWDSYPTSPGIVF